MKKVNRPAVYMSLLYVFYAAFYAIVIRDNVNNYMQDHVTHLKSIISSAKKGMVLDNFYSIFHAICKTLVIATGGFHPIIFYIIVLAAFNLLTVYVTYRVFKKALEDEKLAIIFSLAACFIGNIFFSVKSNIRIYPYIFFNANTLHNPTFTAMKAFSILASVAFVYYINSLQERASGATLQNRADLKSLLLIELWLILSLIAKPSYAIIFIPASYAFTALLCIFKRIKFADMAKFLGVLSLLNIIISAEIIMVAKTFFGGNSDSKIIFDGFKLYMSYCSGKPIPDIIAKLLLPIFIFVAEYKKSPNIYKRAFEFSFVMFVFAILVFGTFAQSGPHYKDGNFGWGVTYSLFQMYAVCILIYAKNNKEYFSKNKIIKRIKKDWLFGINSFIIAVMLVRGIIFSVAIPVYLTLAG